MSTVISVENISKQYRLGQVGTGTLSDDLTRLWCRLRGKEDPFLKIGQTNDRTKKSDVPVEERKKGIFSRSSLLATRNSPDLVWALKDVNFEVKQGEVLGIIGRNGAGKSTLLKILARVTTPTTGCVKVKGRIASLLEVGTGFHPDLTGRENIYLNGAILGMRKHEISRSLDEIIDFSGCERYIDTPVKRYSSGMYVRLAFAVAAHLEPEILIIDEVLAVGDAEFQKKCLGKMKDVASHGRTVLFVSHNMAAVRTLCSGGLFLSNGAVNLHSDIETVANAYMSFGTSAALHHTVKIKPPDNACDIRMETMTLLCNSECSSDFEYGDNLSFLVTFHTETTIQKPLLGFMIRSSRGENIISANNIFLPSSEFSTPIKCGTIRCDLGLVPLMKGKYTVSLWFGRHAHELHYAEDAVAFEVEEKDIWQRGKLPPHRISCLWWPTSFTFLQ